MISPIPEVHISMVEHEGTACFESEQHLCATPNSATAILGCTGDVGWFSTASRSFAGSASFLSGWRIRWKGPGPRCPRKVLLQATGYASVAVTATCSANSGCTASAAGSAAGGCSSIGDASADIQSGELKCTASYESGSQAWKLGGSIGAQVQVETPSVTGNLNSEANWLVKGQGTCSGTCSLVVKPDRSFCAFTNRSILGSTTGTVGAAGSATVANDGSASFRTEANLALWVG